MSGYPPGTPAVTAWRMVVALVLGGLALAVVSCCGGAGLGSLTAGGAPSVSASPFPSPYPSPVTVTVPAPAPVAAEPTESAALEDPAWATTEPALAEPRPLVPARPAPPAPTSDPQPDPPAEPASGSYVNCAEARSAGAAPLSRGDPGYRAGLDRDDDGVACE